MNEDFSPILNYFLMASLNRVNMASSNDPALLVNYFIYSQSGLLELTRFAIRNKNLSLCLKMIEQEKFIVDEIKNFVRAYFEPIKKESKLFGLHTVPTGKYKEKK